MIVVRNVFQLKFGKAKEAVALWKEGRKIAERLGGEGPTPRVMTDLVGKFYTFVIEIEHPSVVEMERDSQRTMSQPEWQSWYHRFGELVESGYREIFTVVE
jgi:hypothetical protein